MEKKLLRKNNKIVMKLLPVLLASENQSYCQKIRTFQAKNTTHGKFERRSFIKDY